MGTQCAAGSKAAAGRREHAPFPQEQADAQGGVRPRHRGPDSRAVPEPNDRAERGSGPSRSLPGPGGSRTCLCGRPFTHPREQPQPQQPSPVLGSARCSHRDQSAPKADSCGAQLPRPRGLQAPTCSAAPPGLWVAIRAQSNLGSQSRQ